MTLLLELVWRARQTLCNLTGHRAARAVDTTGAAWCTSCRSRV
jgi:hypothetical protein